MVSQELRKKIILGLDIVLAVIGTASAAALLLLVGFYLSAEEVKACSTVIDFVIVIFILQELVRWFIAKNIKQYAKERWIENLFAAILLIGIVYPPVLESMLLYFFPELTFKQVTILGLIIIELGIFFVILIKALRYNYLISRIKLHPGAIFAISFAIIITAGTIMLALPRSTPTAESLPIVDALFTSTSAVCVTGLIVVDTATAFTPLGKIIIICLIQIGGLGVMTITTFFATFFAGGLSYRVRILMKDLLSPEYFDEVTGLLLKITMFTFVIEAVGAVIIYLSTGGSIWQIDRSLMFSAVFHSISAFCNAGFSLFSENLMNPLVQSNYTFCTTIMMLIVLGGLGFGVLSNLYLMIFRRRSEGKIRTRLTISSKLVIVTTAILIFAGGTVIFLFEIDRKLTALSLFDGFFHSVFLSVTARTAGFNTTAIELLSAPTAIVIIFLMWVGASPGGTGGGIKTTTFSLALLSLVNQIRGRQRLELFRRQIATDSLVRAYNVIFASLIALTISIVLLCWLEPDKDPLALAFEAVSALGTVGLSQNVTFSLGTGGKVIIILLMYIGRIGVLTFLLAFYKPEAEPRYTLPHGSLPIG